MKKGREEVESAVPNNHNPVAILAKMKPNLAIKGEAS